MKINCFTAFAFGTILLTALAPAQPSSIAAQAVAIPLVHRFGADLIRWHESLHAVTSSTQVNFTRLDYLISGVRLERPDGSLASFPNQYFLISPTEDKVALSILNVPAGPYSSITFTVGVDREANHADPAQWPIGHALNPLENNLHWNWKGGYVFLAAEGRMSGPSGSPAAFLYHIGNDENATTITLPIMPAVDDLSTLRIVFHADRLWKGPAPIRVDEKETFTHSAVGDTLAPRLAKNLQHCFEVERAP